MSLWKNLYQLFTEEPREVNPENRREAMLAMMMTGLTVAIPGDTEVVGNYTSTPPQITTPTIGAPVTITTVNTTQAPTAITLEEKLTRILQKHDVALTADLKTDYTSDSAQGRVSIILVPQTNEQDTKNEHLQEYGLFNRIEDTLYLSTASIQNDDGATSHEFPHIVLDNMGKVGLARQPTAQVPNDEQLKAHTDQVLERPDFDQIKRRVSAYVYQEGIKKNTVALDWLNGLAKESLAIYRDLLEPLVAVAPKDRTGNITTLITRINEFIQRADKYNRGIEAEYVKVDPEIKAWRFGFSGVNQAQLNDKLDRIVKAYGEEMVELYPKGKDLLADTIIGYLEEKIAHSDDEITTLTASRDRATDDLALSVIQSDLTQARQERRELKEKRASINRDSLRGYGEQIALQLGDPEEIDRTLQKTRKGVDNMKRAKDMVGEPEEMLARMVDSLYSIYLGDTTDAQFQLTRGDLNFLRQYRTAQGELIFKKGIEKYELALDLLDQGWKKKDIKRKLEYATGATITKSDNTIITYDWSQNTVTIKGRVPRGDFPLKKAG